MTGSEAVETRNIDRGDCRVVYEVRRGPEGAAAGYSIAGATPTLLDCYAPWERWGLRRSPAMFKPVPWGLLKPWMSAACVQSKEARPLVRAMFERLDKREFVRRWEGIACRLHPEQGSRFDAPLAVCCGARDRTGTIRAHMKQWRAAYPGAEAEQIPGAAHVVDLDAPEAFHKLLLGFAARCA